MFADKMTRVFSCKKWIVFKRLNPLTINPAYSSKRNITNNSQLVKKLLYSNNCTCANSLVRSLHGENAHAYKVMSNSTAYSNSMSPTLSVTEDLKIDSIENLLEKQWISMSNSEILQNFKLLSYYAHQNSEDFNHLKYKGIFEILSEKCSDFSDKELLDFLGLLQFWGNSEIYNNSLWQALDKTCQDRLPNLTTEQIFLISDYIFKMNVIQHSSFIYHGMRKLDPKQMTPANLVQYAFLMKVKGPIAELRINAFEFHIEKNVDNFSVEECGIICMAFFKYQTAIRNRKLLVKIIQKLQADIDNVTDISLSCILKALRYSADLNIVLELDVLLKLLESQVEDRSLMTSTHIALMQATLLIDNQDLLQKIIERSAKEIESTRVKDIERMTFALFTFNCNPKTTPFYGIAAEELQSPRRKSEISKFIKPYLYTINYMLKVNHFPEEMVKSVMTPEFINRFCDNDISTLDREYLDMSYCLQIDHPEYQGPQLRKDQIRYLLKKCGVHHKGHSYKFQKVDHAGKLMIDVAHYFKLTLGSEVAVHLDCPLPYSNRPYIFLCYDPATKSFVPPAEPFTQIPLGEIKYAPKDGKLWAAVIPASHNVLTRNSIRPTGTLAMQMRHLERIGYKLVIVNFSVWHNLYSKSKKFEFVTQILSDLQSEAT